VELVYRVADRIGDLALNEATVRSARDTEGCSWWQLWAWVLRADTGEPFYVAAPVNPNGPYHEVGRKTWGLIRVGENDWQVSPSIDVLGALKEDGTREPSPWHQTPRIVGVPAGERWTTEAP
jgi:hypothetical protein